MRSFASDNNSGVHPRIMEALSEANRDHAFGYGDDRWTEEAVEKIKECFTPECEPLFVFNGTGSNAVALQLLTRPYNSILCAETAHIYVDECGSPAKMTGCQIRPIHTPDGKLTPDLIRPYLHGFGDQHHSQPGVIYLSQCTELGTVYTADELKTLTSLAHKADMFVHMDGARLANAAAALNTTLKALTVDCGIDILSLGGTKNGLMMGECVVIFRKGSEPEARFFRKQASQLASKMRFLSCQFIPYLTDDLWRKNAAHANDMARSLQRKLERHPEIRFTQKTESNALFLTMPRPVIEELQNEYAFYYWNEAACEVRFVTSFDTTQDDVERFGDALEQILSRYRQL